MRFRGPITFVAVVLAAGAATFAAETTIALVSIRVFDWAKSAWQTEIAAQPTEFYILQSLLSQIVYLLVAVVVSAVLGLRGAVIMVVVLVGDHLAWRMLARALRGIAISSTPLWHEALTYITATVSGAVLGLALRRWRHRVRCRPPGP